MGYRYKEKKILEETKHISKQTKKMFKKSSTDKKIKFSIKKTFKQISIKRKNF